jgi:hypothetical protein
VDTPQAKSISSESANTAAMFARAGSQLSHSVPISPTERELAVAIGNRFPMSSREQSNRVAATPKLPSVRAPLPLGGLIRIAPSVLN